MAMACALSCSLSALSLTAPVSSSVSSSSNSSLQGLRLAGVRLRVAAPLKVVYQEKRNVVIKAAAEETIAAAPATPAESVSSLKLESEMLKKKAKKEELRRKRLVRKRHLRKKGRWPPSKVNKNKNI